MFCLGLVLLIIKWCFLKSHRWTKLQLNNVGAQFDTVLIVVCFPWINWEAVMVPYSGACTLAWHCDKSNSQLQLIHKHCKLQVKLSSIASFCSTRASALTYTDYFDINYSLTEPNVLYKCTYITGLEGNVWHYLHVKGTSPLEGHPGGHFITPWLHVSECAWAGAYACVCVCETGTEDVCMH